jgi:hypothetical protein
MHDYEHVHSLERLQSPSLGSMCAVPGPPHWLAVKEPAICIYVRGHAGPHSWEPEED